MGDRPAQSRFCWRCGAPLEWPRCTICRERLQLTFLLDELDRWAADETVTVALELAVLRQRYEQRLTELSSPPKPTVVVPPPSRPTTRSERGPLVLKTPTTPLPASLLSPPPARPAPPPVFAQPPPAAPPDEPVVDLSAAWDRLRSVAGLTWLYAVGVMFFVAGLAWLVSESARQPWARWMLVGVVGALAGLALRHGQRLLARHELQLGGQALLAIGVLLTPATVFALRAAVGADDRWLAVGAWVIGAGLALALAATDRLASQLLLGDGLWAAAALTLATIATAEPDRLPAWCSLFLAPAAAVNGWLAWRSRRTTGERAEAFVQAARLGGLGLATAASLAWLATVVSTPWGHPDPALIVAPLLLAGALVGLAWETARPELIAWAAAAMYLGCGVFDSADGGLVGQTLGVFGLLLGAAASRRQEFRLWFAGSATAAATLLLLPWLTVTPPPWRLAQAAVGGWVLTGMYLALTLFWRQRWLLWTTTVVAVAALVLTVRWSGAPGRAEPLWLALLALVPLLPAATAGEAEWSGRRLKAELHLLPFVPLLLSVARGQTLPEPVSLTGGFEALWAPALAATLVALASGEPFGLWLSWYAAALWLTPRMSGVINGEAGAEAAGGALALAGAYTVGAVRRRSDLWLASAAVAATLAALFGLAWSWLPVGCYSGALAALALMQLGLARAVADRETPHPAEALRWLALVPLGVGYAAGLVTGVTGGFDPVVVAGLVAVAAAAGVLSRELCERRVLYLAAAGVVTAAALLAQPLPDWADAWLTVALTAAGLTAVGLLDRDYGAPLEAAGAAVQAVVLAASLAETVVDHGWPVAARLAVAAATFAVPVARPVLARTHQPAETIAQGWRQWPALVAALGAGGCVTADLGHGGALGVALVALGAVTLAGRSSERIWREVLSDGGAAVAAVMLALALFDSLNANRWPVTVRLVIAVVTFAWPAARTAGEPAAYLEERWRQWLALLAALAAGGSATALTGHGAALGLGLVALLAVLLAGRLRDPIWRGVLSDGGAASQALMLLTALFDAVIDNRGLVATRLAVASLTFAWPAPAGVLPLEWRSWLALAGATGAGGSAAHLLGYGAEPGIVLVALGAVLLAGRLKDEVWRRVLSDGGLGLQAVMLAVCLAQAVLGAAWPVTGRLALVVVTFAWPASAGQIPRAARVWPALVAAVAAGGCVTELTGHGAAAGMGLVALAAVLLGSRLRDVVWSRGLSDGGAGVATGLLLWSLRDAAADNGWLVAVRLGLAALTLAWPAPAGTFALPGRAWLTVIAAAGAGGCVTALTGQGGGLGVTLVGLLAVANARRASDAAWRRVLADAGVPTAVAGGLMVIAQPSLWGLAVLLVGETALLLAAAERRNHALLAGGLWMLVTVCWEMGAPWSGRPATANRLPWSLAVWFPAGWQALLLRRQTAAGPALLLTLIPSYGLVAAELAPGQAELWWLGLIALAAWLAVVLEPRSVADAGDCAWLGMLTAMFVAVGAITVEKPVEATVLLAAGTAVMALLTRLRNASVALPVTMGHLTAGYALGMIREVDDVRVFAFRLGLLAFADTVLAATLRRLDDQRQALSPDTAPPCRAELRQALLGAAGCVAVLALLLLWPADRPTVFGLLAIAGACFTAAYAAGEPMLNDLGFGCAWLAWCIFLLDGLRKGRLEMAPYRSLDLYVVPIGLYLLAAVERRSAQPGAVRWTWAVSILGSLLVSSFAAVSPGHDAALFVAVLGAVIYGVARPDAAVRWLGLGTFALYVILQAWRWRTGAGKAMLIAMLIAAGVGTIVIALRAERQAAD